MSKAGNLLHHPAHTNDTPEVRVPREKGPKQDRDRKNTPRAGEHATGAKRASAKDRAVGIQRVKSDSRPLLIGAGLAAAVALTVIALRGKQRAPTVALFASPNSTFLSAMVKAVAFAVERTATHGSLTSLVARAVGRAATG